MQLLVPLQIAAKIFFVEQGPLLAPSQISLCARGAPPPPTKTFLCPTMSPTRLDPVATAGSRVQEVAICFPLGLGIFGVRKKLARKGGSGRAGCLGGRGPNFESESAIRRQIEPDMRRH